MNNQGQIPLVQQPDAAAMTRLRHALDGWMHQAGFEDVRITDTDLSSRRNDLEEWLAGDFHGEMEWMRRHLDMRLQPDLLEPGTRRVISARMNYLPEHTDALAELENGRQAYISLYARGRDYHKLMRRRLARVADLLRGWCDEHRYRALVDSAPVLEKPLAEKAGLGWLGKHTLLINRQAGSWFFLGEIYTSLPLPVDEPTQRGYCGNCQACMDVCPTGAIVGPWRIDARRCISYLTIEHPGTIPVELRPLIGNRVFGCDDCQLVCPWNRSAETSREPAFTPRAQWSAPQLKDLFGWDENTWKEQTEGSPIRRSGYQRWLRNLAVALGNAPADPEILQALQSRSGEPDPVVREHVEWALAEQQRKLSAR